MFGHAEGAVVPLQDLNILPKTWSKSVLTGGFIIRVVYRVKRTGFRTEIKKLICKTIKKLTAYSLNQGDVIITGKCMEITQTIMFFKLPTYI